MKISKIPGLGRFGVFIDDVDFNHLTDEEWLEIGKIHMNSLVTIIRNINLDHELFPTYIWKFGQPRFAASTFLQKKYNKPILELIRLATDNDPSIEDADKRRLVFGRYINTKTKHNTVMQRVQGGFDEEGHPLGLFAEGELGWHSNEPGALSATPGVALYGNAGMVGSATGFCTTVDYYESVSESFRSELNEMIVVHKFNSKPVTGLNDTQTLDTIGYAACPVDYAEVPLVMDSPGGIRGLHYSYGTSYQIKGMSLEQSSAVFAELEKNLFTEKYTYDHWYTQNNDLLLFDNSITNHRRLGNTDGRLAFRTIFDYTAMQDDFYQPYSLHPSVARKYISEIKDSVRLNNIKPTQFKMPTALDYVKTFF